MDEYDIYVRGFAWDRVESPVAGLQRVFGIPEAHAVALIEVLPKVVKRRVPAEQLPRYAQALEGLGADFEFRRSAIQPRAIVAVVGGTRPAEVEPDTALSLPPPPPAPSQPPPPAQRYPATVLGRDPALEPEPAGRFIPGHERTEPSPPPVFDEEPPRASARPPVTDSNRTVREAPPLISTPPPSQRTHPLGGELPMGSWRAPAPSAPPPPLAAPPVAAPAPPPAAPPPAPSPPQAEPRGPLLSARPPRPDDRVYNVWAPLESLASAPGEPFAPGPSKALPASVGHELGKALSAPPPAPGLELDIDGRPAWLLDGARALHDDGFGQALPSPASPVDPWAAPDQQGTSVAPAAPPPSASAPPPSRPPGPASVPPAALAALEGRPRPRAPARVVGVYVVPSTAVQEPAALLRWLLRAGLGLSMFMVLAMVRHCRAFDSDVQEQLTTWGEQPTLSEAAAPGTEAPGARPSELGPPAGEWLDSELHQVSSADKDQARSLVQRLKQAGALEVYMGKITRSGPMQIAGELVVALPHDRERRKRVLDEYQNILDARFSGFAAKPPEPGGDYLYITL